MKQRRFTSMVQRAWAQAQEEFGLPETDVRISVEVRYDKIIQRYVVYLRAAAVAHPISIETSETVAAKLADKYAEWLDDWQDGKKPDADNDDHGDELRKLNMKPATLAPLRVMIAKTTSGVRFHVIEARTADDLIGCNAIAVEYRPDHPVFDAASMRVRSRLGGKIGVPVLPSP